MKSLLATLPLAVLGIACGQACRANMVSFECCSPTIDLPDVASFAFGSTGSLSDFTLSVPTSNPSDTPGLTALLALTGAHESGATLTVQTPSVIETDTFGNIVFTGFTLGSPNTSVTFAYNSLVTEITPVPIADTFWLLLAWLGGIFWFGLHRKRAA
jgi:hypothetical protein